MINHLKSIYELNDINSKFIFFNTATNYLIHDWHYNYIIERNFIIDYEFQKYLYLNSIYDNHHFNNEYHYNICLQKYSKLLNFNFNINDFYYKHHNGLDISYDYLYPINDNKQFNIFFYDQNEIKYEYNGNYNCLLNFDYKRKTEINGDYHLMYVACQNQSIINNYGENNDKTLLIIGDSQILPEIPIFAYYYKKVLYYDNRYKNNIMNDILYNEQIDDCLVQMWAGRKLYLYELT